VVEFQANPCINAGFIARPPIGSGKAGLVQEGDGVLADVRLDLLGSAVIHAQKVLRFLAARVGDSGEGQDLMQKIYLRILRLQKPEGIRDPRAYLFKVAANIAHEHRLRRNTQSAHVAWDDVADHIIRADAGAASKNPICDRVAPPRWLRLCRDRRAVVRGARSGQEVSRKETGALPQKQRPLMRP
jgi:DNA-directed RNA polymerase specialized sigma24 family protein